MGLLCTISYVYALIIPKSATSPLKIKCNDTNRHTLTCVNDVTYLFNYITIIIQNKIIFTQLALKKITYMTIKSQLTGNWNDQKSKLRKKYPALTDKDVFFEIGRKNEMLANLQVKLSKTKEELRQIIEAL